LKSRVPEIRFQAFWGEILQNSEDYKVHRRLFPDISNFLLGIGKIGKVTLKNRRSRSGSPYFPSVMLGEENPNVILIRNVAFKSF
jgi:hypothetical protein